MSECVTFELPDRLTIAQVESLHEKLEPILHNNTDVALEGKAVVQADTAGLQTLLAFAKTLEKRGAHMSWSSKSDALNEAIAHLGLQESLGGNG